MFVDEIRDPMITSAPWENAAYNFTPELGCIDEVEMTVDH